MNIRFGRASCAELAVAERHEWLVTNGIGGYALGTIAGILTRRYHGLLVGAAQPPVGRVLLVPKIDERLVYFGRTYALGTNRWADGTIDPRGHLSLESFALDGSAPVWRFAAGDALLEKRVWMAYGANVTCVRYTLLRAQAAAELTFDIFGDGRDHHGTTRASGTPVVELRDGGVAFAAPGEDAWRCHVSASGVDWTLDGSWYYRFQLERERERGLPDVEDHFRAAHGSTVLAPGASVTLVLSAHGAPLCDLAWESFTARERSLVAGWREAARRGAEDEGWTERLAIAADQFIVRGARGPTVIAGYPWFTDWGRDTMIALPGLAFACGRYDVARSILETFARSVDRGMIPNRFAEAGDMPEYNTVDATLWFVLGIDALGNVLPGFAGEMAPIVADIIDHHDRGTRYGIVRDPDDGLLAAGEPGVQLTWMDAKVGDTVVTPRIGKPIEVNALWINALRAASRIAARAGADGRRFDDLADLAARSFGRYWNERRGYCFDVLDGPDGDDESLRPNQLFAIALEEVLLPSDRARAVVDACARALLTSYGLRSLSCDDPRYAGRYDGDPARRDGAYHQGTAWCWLLGPFAVAHFRAYGDAREALEFLKPLQDALTGYGLGTLGEIFDGDAPHDARGCPAQAWSVGQTLAAWRLLRDRSVAIP